MTIPLNGHKVTDKVERALRGENTRPKSLKEILGGYLSAPDSEGAGAITSPAAHGGLTASKGSGAPPEVDGTGFGLSPSHETPEMPDTSKKPRAVDPTQGRGNSKIHSTDPLLDALIRTVGGYHSMHR
jgi:hypothetical protein